MPATTNTTQHLATLDIGKHRSAIIAYALNRVSKRLTVTSMVEARESSGVTTYQRVLRSSSPNVWAELRDDLLDVIAG